MNRITIFLLTLIMTWTAASATDVTCGTPGSLPSQMSDPASVTTLSLSGVVDASDLYYIGSAMPALTRLDLSGATIAAYAGDDLNGSTEYAAGLIPPMAFAGTRLEQVAFPASGTFAIGECAFTGTALRTVTLPDNMTSAGMGAFSACPKLTQASLGAATLGNHVFSSCPALAAVTLRAPAAVPASAFEGCAALATVAGSDKATGIGARAFMGCTALKKFTFGTALSVLGGEAFAMSGLREADLSGSKLLDAIGDWAFARCADLATVRLNDATATLGKGVFCDDANLASFNLPASATVVDSYAFKGDNKIDTTYLLHKDVTHIGDYAFKDMDHVTSITMPAALESIGDYAMEGTSALTRIDAMGLTSAPATGKEVWAGVNRGSVKLLVDKTYLDEFKNAPQWQDFDIVAMTGVDDITADTPAASVTGRFAGYTLQVASGAADISAVSLYDLQGRLLASLHNIGATSASIDTEGLQGRVFVVRVILADGIQASIKLARNI